MILKDIYTQTKENNNFRKVIYTGKHSQVVIMSLNEGEDIGMEVHENVDQILFIVSGKADTVIDEERSEALEGDVIFVPSGKNHNIINTGEGSLKLYTVYSPPQHPDGTVHPTKADAMEDEE